MHAAQIHGYNLGNDSVAMLGYVAIGAGVLYAAGVPQSWKLTSIFLISIGMMGAYSSDGKYADQKWAGGIFLLLGASLLTSLFINMCQQQNCC